MAKCSYGNCDLEVFENSDKCILHSNKKNWDICDDKLLNDFEEIFLDKYHDEVNKDNLIILNIHFPRNIFSRLINKIPSNTIAFNNSVFYGNIELENNECLKSKIIFFSNCITDNFIFKQIDVTKLGIFLCGFKKLEVDSSEINNFYLENNKTDNPFVDIKNTDFDLININKFITNNFKISNIKSDITILSNMNIDNLNFSNNTFLDRLEFINVEIKNKIDLQDSFIPTNSSFFGLKSSKGIVDVANRETARKIKDSFEKQNNIIEANKFYALEMKEREKELEEDLKKGKNFFEWLVFKIHGISSNHSQDWLLALFWILNITFSLLTTQESIKIFENSLVAYIPIITMIVLGVITSNIDDKKSLTIFLFLITFLNFGVFKIISKEHSLDCISQKINPFSIMTELSNIDFVTFVYKIIIAYLIYQFIVSIRQNTRRK